MRSLLAIAAIGLLAAGCAPTVSCSKVPDPPFGDRIALGGDPKVPGSGELAKDGPVSQKWIENYSTVLESCGY